MKTSTRVPPLDRSLTGRRVVVRTLLGLLSRGSQGLLLAGAIWQLGAVESADLAVALASSTAFNLLSNVGIPTLFVRHRLNRPDVLMSMARAYIALTIIAAVGLALFLGTFVSSLPLVVATAALMSGQSLFSGLEYWEIGRGNRRYDHFLRTCSAPQALMSVLPLPLLVICGTAWPSVLLLAATFHLPVAAWAIRHSDGLVGLRSTAGQPIRWVRQAAAVGSGTALAACFYVADVLMLRSLAEPDVLANYRMAVVIVAFAVGVLPLNLFLLADVAAGHRTRTVPLLALGTLGTASMAVAGLLLKQTSTELAQVGEPLMLLAVLVAIRIGTQVFVSEMNGRGAHGLVAFSFGVGLLLWTGSYLCLRSLPELTEGPMAIAQVAVESGTCLAMYILLRRRARALDLHPRLAARS